MTPDPNNPRIPGEEKKEPSENAGRPDVTPRREGGDDSLAESSPGDHTSDEKVIVNEQKENKTVNTPSQTGVHTNGSSDDEIIE